MIAASSGIRSGAFDFTWEDSGNIFVKAKGIDKDGRGQTTCDLIGLNDDDLMEERARSILTLEAIALTMRAAQEKQVNNKISYLSKVINEETSSKNQFAGFKRRFFHKHG